MSFAVLAVNILFAIKSLVLCIVLIQNLIYAHFNRPLLVKFHPNEAFNKCRGAS